MTNSSSVKSTGVRFQQMLFGYDRGHGLLASSRGASKSLASKILPDTDWDPRVAPKVDCYISARPVQGEKTYVIMKTWRAPEMSRPGCVWTHVLAIADADLSRIPDLRILAHKMKRPIKQDSFQPFTSEIVLDELAPTEIFDESEQRVVRNLVKLVYSGGIDQNLIENEDSVEEALLAIWSQQWPALRRQFSFRSAPLSRTKLSRRSEFDVELKEGSSTNAPTAPELNPHVLDLIVRDVMNASTTQYRRFLWRYGADTGATRENLLFLTRVYQEFHQSDQVRPNLASLVTEIGKRFPEQSTALLLKKDLTQPSDSNYSMLPAIDPFDVAIGVQSSPHAEAFPDLGALDQSTITSWITTRPKELTKLLTRTADDGGPFADSLFKGVANSKNADFIWTVFSQSKTAFLRALDSSIEFLDDDRIQQVDDDMLLATFQKSKPPSKKALKKLVPRLLLRSNTDLIAAVHGTVPEAVTTAVVRKFAANIEFDQLGNSVHRNWVECVEDDQDGVIDFAENRAQTRTEILACRYLLNADSKRLPLTVWSARLGGIGNDLHGYLDTEFRVFLLIQALSQPSETAPVIFEDAFDHVYDALVDDRLNFRTEMQLSDYLPHIGWLNNWDKRLRLKIAMVAAYKHLGLSKKQLQRITSNDNIGYELGELWSNS